MSNENQELKYVINGFSKNILSETYLPNIMLTAKQQLKNILSAPQEHKNKGTKYLQAYTSILKGPYYIPKAS